MTAAQIFHRHVEACVRCASDVFNLCPVGAAALKRAAKELAAAKSMSVAVDQSVQKIAARRQDLEQQRRELQKGIR